MPTKVESREDESAHATQNDSKISPSERERLTQQVAIMQKAVRAQNAARNLRAKAKKIADPKERERIIREAYEKEVEAHGQSKLAQRMQSGAWQGFGLGGGIGGGIGLGLGAVVGTLVGGLVSIPTTGLGMLVGTGVGIVHGPFIKFGGGKEKSWEDAKPEEVVDAIEQGRITEVQDQENVPPPSSPPPRKKPRKIEIRSQPSTTVQHETTAELSAQSSASGEDPVDHPANASTSVDASHDPPLRKPRKIQIRSQPKNQTLEPAPAP